MPGDLVRVLTTSSVPEGEIAKARLEDEGIPVLAKGGGEDPYRIGPVHLYVPADLEVQARFVLTQTFGTDDDTDTSVDDREGGREPGTG